jgi:hypothetical protein
VSAVDPIRAQRNKARRLAKLGKRIGYCLWLVSIIFYVIGSTGTFTTPIVNVIVGGLIAGSVFLIPAIIVSYGVNAAEREDRAAGRV